MSIVLQSCWLSKNFAETFDLKAHWDICSALKDKGCKFSLSLRLGSSFNFSLSSEGYSPEATKKTRRSSSYLRRQTRRRAAFLERKKKLPLADVVTPTSQTKTTHPQSQAQCPPSADSTDIENTVIQQNGDWISHPRSPSPINQFDGTSDPCDRADDRGQLSDANDDNQILCAMCNLKMTPTHQCCETDKTQLKSEYDKFMQKYEEGLVAGLKACNNTHLIEGALNNHRLRYDFETWQRM